MTDLSTTYLGLHLKNPLVAAASPLSRKIDRARKLEEAGIVSRTAHPGYPLRVDYELTDAGRRLVPLIDALGDWWEQEKAA